MFKMPWRRLQQIRRYFHICDHYGDDFSSFFLTKLNHGSPTYLKPLESFDSLLRMSVWMRWRSWVTRGAQRQCEFEISLLGPASRFWHCVTKGTLTLNLYILINFPGANVRIIKTLWSIARLLWPSMLKAYRKMFRFRGWNRTTCILFSWAIYFQPPNSLRYWEKSPLHHVESFALIPKFSLQPSPFKKLAVEKWTRTLSE